MGAFDAAYVEGSEAFLRGDMDAAREQLLAALRMKKAFDNPDLLDVHRRLGDLYYQWPQVFSGDPKEKLAQAEKHYVQFLRLAKSLIGSPAYAASVRQAHPYARTPEASVFEEYVGKLSGVYMAQGISIDKAERKAKNLGKAGCFIATAACGSDMAPEVQLLRRFRDERLSRGPLGRGLIRLYELLSPPVAEWLIPRDRLCAVVRKALIHPLAKRVGGRMG